METGIELIAQERKEQIEKHGRTIQSDVLWNKNRELLQAAVVMTGIVVGLGFPDNWDKEVCSKMTDSN